MTRSCAFGVAAAALLLETGLRPFVTGWNQSETEVRTIRTYTEGWSVAHFQADGLGTFGNRLTGNPPLAVAPEGIILGDSHVIAQAVRDDETMGAVIERLARGSGRPLNVRQYGWSSGNAPTFLAAAKPLLKDHNPAWIAVVLDASNIGVYALTTTQNWRMEVAPDYSVRLIDVRPPPAGRWQQMRRAIGRSALALALWRRFGEFENRPASASHPDPRLAEEASRVPRATVLALKQAYGSRLIIVYTPSSSGTHFDDEPIDQELLTLCAENGVACLPVRDALERDMYEHAQLSRGFHNTAPGVGHFNATGHQIIGQEIWRFLSTRDWPLD
jgi:hypothetical protein